MICLIDNTVLVNWNKLSSDKIKYMDAKENIYKKGSNLFDLWLCIRILRIPRIEGWVTNIGDYSGKRDDSSTINEKQTDAISETYPKGKQVLLILTNDERKSYRKEKYRKKYLVFEKPKTVPTINY